MKATPLFTLVGVAAFATGGVLWLATHRTTPDPARLEAPAISGAALYAASFRDAEGRQQPLGRFQDRWLVVNFWATWCGPCREEMPTFSRLQREWGARGVQFVGLSSEAPELALSYGREQSISYPLWTGGPEVMELSRRLGNVSGVLPHSAVIAPGGRVVAGKVGAYSETELAKIIPTK